jgi:hypothetical protein
MAAPATSDHIPPSTASYVFATAVIAGVIGYFAGQGSSLGLFSSSSARPKQSTRETDGEESDSEDDSEEEAEDVGELATFEGNHDEVKLVLVVRTDLGMGKGK